MSKGRFNVRSRKFVLIVAASVLLTILAIVGIYRWKRGQNSSLADGQRNREETSLTEAVNPYKIAVQKVEEDRGEPVGNQAEIKIPAELKLYKDRRRFLAIQIAEWREQKYEIPRDFSELASMTRQGEFTILPTLGASYILYGVGLKANDELTHYDQKTGKSIPLFRDEKEIEEALQRLNKTLEESDTRVRELRNESQRLGKNERALRLEKLKQIAAEQKTAAAVKASRDLINSYYETKEHAQTLTDEYRKLTELARDFDGQSFDLNDPEARKKFKVQLLSALRPPARLQLEEIAKAYQEKFNRPLPITSLVRTIEYQRLLGESGNPNAIQIDVPPHTTGLAFDIYTYYMSAGEQQFLMDEIARLEREGRVEALRENRYHIHVFAFADMKPPEERLVKESLTMKATAADGEQ